MKQIIQQAERFTKHCLSVQENFKMSAVTSFRAGGCADLYLAPKDIAGLTYVIQVCETEHIPYLILGKGTNLLVRDGGYRGIIIDTSALSDIYLEEELVVAQAGATLSAVCNFSLNQGLCGMEALGGIPGTVGGGVYMNAGAFGTEIKDVLEYAEILGTNGRCHKKSAEELELSYRSSKLMQEKGVVLSAAFRLERGNVLEAKERLKELNCRRREKQPLTFPNAGSTFKRIEGRPAAAMIDEAGLKGTSIGGAQVSEKHAGFIINTGGASAKDITDLIELVQKRVEDKFGLLLPVEVEIIGEE